MKKVVFLFIGLLSVLILGITDVKALSVSNISVSDIVTEENGDLTSFRISFKTPGTFGTAISRIAIQSMNLGVDFVAYSNNMLTNNGIYYSDHHYTIFVNNPADCGFITWVGDSFTIESSQSYSFDVSVPPEKTINLADDNTYYVYIWTKRSVTFPSQAYPDAQLFSITSGDGKFIVGPQIKPPTVTFITNGGYLASSILTSTKEYNNEDLTLPTPFHISNTFLGWYDSSFTTKLGDGGDSYNATEDITMYALWNNFKITIDGSNVTYDKDDTYEVEKDSDSIINITAKEGYVISSIKLNDSDDNLITKEAATYKLTLSNINSYITVHIVASVSNPDTSDGIINYMILLITSIITITGVVIYLNKHKLVNNKKA